jgi:hypothetical protein
MKRMKLDPADADAWPAEVAFIPFVGPLYQAGIDGVRTLLLGESHYRRDGVDCSPDVTRPFTRHVFVDRIEPHRSVGEGRFYPALDRMLTGMAHPSADKAASTWRQVAFANLVQEFAGVRPGDRPTSTQFRRGTQILMDYVLPMLRPQVVIVLGRATWNGLSAGECRADLTPYMTESVREGHEQRREIWRLPYSNGQAFMSWTFHPSRGIDQAADMAELLHHLLALAQSSVSKP